MSANHPAPPVSTTPTRRDAVRPVVVNERVFRRRDVPLYAVLSVVNLVAVAALVAFWASRAEWSAQTPAYVLLTVSLGIGVAMFESRWFALPLMRRPKPMPAAPGWRVGVATTFV